MPIDEEGLIQTQRQQGTDQGTELGHVPDWLERKVGPTVRAYSETVTVQGP